MAPLRPSRAPEVARCLLLILAVGPAAAAAPPEAPSRWLDFSLSSSAIPTGCRMARDQATERLGALARLDPRARGLDGFFSFSAILADLSDSISSAEFLGQVSTDPGVRDAGRQCDTDSSRFLVEVYGREDLYSFLKAAKEAPAEPPAGEDARLVEKTLLEFKRNGLELPREKREEVEALKKRIVELETEYRKALAEDNTTVSFTKEQLAGLPDDFVARLPKDGERYKVSLDYPDYFPFLENAQDGAARRELQTLFDSRGGEANTKRLAETLRLRHRAARLLGYPSHAHYRLEDRMAKTPAAVSAFLEELRAKLERKANPELAALLELERDEPGGKPDGTINAWDWRYYHHRLLKTRYAVDDQKIKEYFPLDLVTAGMLGVYQEVLGLRFTEVKPAAAWHPDVTLYRVEDAATGELAGHFYMDLFPREGKYKHAAAFNLIPGRRLADGSYQRPVAAMVANFDKPAEGRPSLLRHDDVKTFFHEFGHIVHQVLTKAKYQRFSGTGVARDFVEAPSQMLENWVWRPEVLERLSGHYQDRGRKLPADLLERMVAAKNVNAGLKYLRQAFFASLDLSYHLEPPENPTEVYERLMKKVSLVPMTPGTRPEASFGHVMGGYDTGYYGYLWSEVFALDMFSRFEREGILDPKLGLEYRKIVLEPGGGVDEAATLRRFLGRDPSDEAFLRNIGVDAAKAR